MNRKKKVLYDKKATGGRIRSLRKAKNIKLKDAAQKLDLAPGYIREIESGTSGMSLETAVAFASIFETTLDWLLFENGDMPKWYAKYLKKQQKTEQTAETKSTGAYAEEAQTSKYTFETKTSANEQSVSGGGGGWYGGDDS